MKFEEQVASYHSKLRRRSRFFSSLMLVSGISLAAAAPFLSYEVSQIECAEKGSVVTQDNTDEVQTLKIELENKDETIIQLEQKVEDIKGEISSLASNPDCDNLVRVIENDRDRLAAELAEIAAESTVKDETITDLEREVEIKTQEISNLASNPDCDNLVQVIKKDRDRLAAELKEATRQSQALEESISRLRVLLSRCQEQLEQTSNTEPDCGKYTEEINKLKQTITTKNKIIAELNATPQVTVTCPTITLSGAFHNNETFTVHKVNFRVTINSDDVGAKYQLFRNERNVTSKITNVKKSATYTFMANKINYQLIFGDLKSGSLPYSLTSL